MPDLQTFEVRDVRTRMYLWRAYGYLHLRCLFNVILRLSRMAPMEAVLTACNDVLENNGANYSDTDFETMHMTRTDILLTCKPSLIC